MNRKNIAKSMTIAAVIVAIFNCFFRIVVVRGPSMEPTLSDGNVLLVSTLAEAERGDIIVFWQKNKYMIKRVVGIGGDRIEERDGIVYVNGVEQGKGSFDRDGYIVPKGKYFVMGDNRENSRDSRNFGFIEKYMGVVIR